MPPKTKITRMQFLIIPIMVTYGPSSRTQTSSINETAVLITACVCFTFPVTSLFSFLNSSSLPIYLAPYFCCLFFNNNRTFSHIFTILRYKKSVANSYSRCFSFNNFYFYPHSGKSKTTKSSNVLPKVSPCI